MVHVVSVTVSWPTIDRASTDYDLNLSVSADVGERGLMQAEVGYTTRW